MAVAINLLDLANEGVASAPGTGTTISLSGTAAPGAYLKWSDAGAQNGVVYRIHIFDGNNREIAYATYNTTGNQFTNRTTIIASVNGVKQVTAINASAQALVGVVATAEDLLTTTTQLGADINKFRNPGMDVAQRGTSGSVASGSTAYSLDGWMIVATGATASWSQQYNQNLSGNALRINCATSLTACTLKQRIESDIAADLLTASKSGQPVLVQFTIYNNTGATITPQIAAGYASARDNFATVTSDLAATNLQSIANATSGTVAYIFTPNANSANGYEVQLEFGGALNAATGYVDISFADIRVADLPASTGLVSNPPPPVQRGIGSEILLCQRYFASTYGNGVAPGTATHNGMVAVSSTDADVLFPTGMRAAPTISYWDGAGNASKVSLMATSSGGTPVGLGKNVLSTTGASLAVTCNAAIQAGDLVIFALQFFNSGITVSSVSDGTNTYTRAVIGTNATNAPKDSEIWYKEGAAAVTSPVITANFTSNGGGVIAIAARAPGVISSASLDVTANGTGSISSGTLSQANETLFGVAGGSNGASNDSTDGWTQLDVDNLGTGQYLTLSYKLVSSTASVTYNPTGGNVFETALATFKQSVAGSFTDNNTGGGSAALDTASTGFISGLALGSLIGQGAYFQYTASAEL